MSKIWAAIQRIEKFLDRVLIFCAVSIWTFTIAMTVIFCVKGSVPDTLIDAFFSVFGVEGVLCAVITVVKTIMSKLLDKQLGAGTSGGDDDEDDEYDENEEG